MLECFNVLAHLPSSVKEELVTVLAASDTVRIERIVSNGQCSPPGFWYEQHEHEWVVVLQGEAELLIEGEADPRFLKKGDALLLPARCRHRVERSSAEEATVWLAVFFEGVLEP